MSFKGLLLKRGLDTVGGGLKVTGPVVATGGIGTAIGGGQVFYLDVANGSDNNSGRTPANAMKTLAAAYEKLTDGQNDVLYVIGGGTSHKVTSTFTWAKNYTHLIGLCAPIFTSQRARIVNDGSMDTVMIISGRGCIFQNLQIGQWGSEETDLQCVIVTGVYNYFNNVHFAGMGHATPAAVSTASSLKLDGAKECVFEDCTIGLDTIVRAAANAELVIDTQSTRNIFRGCRFISASETVGHLMLKEADASAMDRWLIFEDCLFYNFSVNHDITLTEAFDIQTGTTHDIILLGKCALVGIDEWDAGDVACLKGLGIASTAADMGLAVTPTHA